MNDKIISVEIKQLNPFYNHPFQVNNDEEMKSLCESIREHGVLSPLMARPKPDGNFEIISGHRRKAAAELLGIENLPVIVRDVTDDQAVIIMVDSNIQRENLLPSERAFSYKMKLEAIKHQGVTSCRLGTKSRSDLELAESVSESARTIQRYIRLTELIKPILDLVDSKRIAFSPAVELSYLTKQEQAELWDIMQQEDCTPSLSQAVRMKKLSQQVKLTPDVIFNIMSEEKANQKEQIRIQADKLRKFFPKCYTIEQIEQSILKLLEERQRKQRSQPER